MLIVTIHLDSVKRSIAVSGGKLICDSSDDDDSSSEKETTKKTGATTRKDLRDDKGFEREMRETHIEQSDRELTPGCTIMFYLLPPHGKITGKYVGPIKRNGKDDKKEVDEGSSGDHGRIIQRRGALRFKVKED